MGLTTSLYTGLSGLSASSQLISVTGNNIANVNTTGFKSSRVDFETQIADTLSRGSAPSGELGGTNPVQIGLGARTGAVMRNFNDGSLQPTGVNTELALEGPGFFIVKSGGDTRYTRAGNFKLDNNFNLVTANGDMVQGYAVDSNYQILTGALQPVSIPLGNRTLVEATKNVRFSGNLNANGLTAVNGTVISTDTLYADASQTTPADASTALNGLYNAGGSQLLTDGDILTLTGVTKGGATLPDSTFQVGATNTTRSTANGTTVGDLMAFFQDRLGIDATVPGGTAGVTISNGAIRIEGNSGSVNEIDLSAADFLKNQSTSPTQPLSFTKSQSADGESVRTTFVAYDSLGTVLNMDLNMVLENKSASGTTWRFYAQSGDNSILNRALGNGTLSFNTDGQLAGVTGNVLNLTRSTTGAGTSQGLTLRFDQPSGAVSALTDTTSQLAALGQDGTALGTLTDFSVSNDGRIVGVFSNSQTRDLGQVVVAKFANPDGLIEKGNNLFAVTAASGDAAILTPGSNGVGTVVGGALELSNVDLSQEFINLITASTGFTANSKVLTTADQLVQQLLATLR